MDLNENGAPMQPTKTFEGGTIETWSWIRPWTWINVERWVWMFKYGAIYVVAVYIFLIGYQIIAPKESTVERLKNMMEKDEKWAEVQSAYDRKPREDADELKTRMKPVDLAKTSWKKILSEPFVFFFDQIFAILSYLNDVRIHLLGDIWKWIHEKVTDFISRRSARIH